MAVPQEALDRHVKMTTDLDNHISQSIDKDQYEQLKNRLKSELTPKDLVSGANSIMDILNCLERKGTVKPGKYDTLKKIMSEFDVRIVDNVIEPAEKAIKDIILKHEKSLVSLSSELDTGEATGCTSGTVSGGGLADLQNVLGRINGLANALGTEGKGEIDRGNGCFINWSFKGMLMGFEYKYVGICVDRSTGLSATCTQQSKDGAIEHSMQDLFGKLAARQEL